MRVANFIEEGKLGGPQVRIVRVAVELKGKVDTIVIMPKANSDAFREICVKNDVSFKRMFITRITKKLIPALCYVSFSLFELVRIAWFFRKKNVDLVHASGGSWQVKAVIAARIANVPAVWHLNDTMMPCWIRMLFRCMQPLASGFIFASYRSRDYYKNLISGDRPEAVVSSAVDLSYFKPDGDMGSKSLDRDVDERTDGGLLIGTIANISPVKGLETLVRSVGLLVNSYPQVRVVVAGAIFPRQEKYYLKISKLANELGVSVDWMGACTNVRSFLQKLDIYVCSSVAESSPSSVWEAMAMAKPIVSTDVGDVSRHLNDGSSGFIVPVGDYDAMAERIKELLDSSELRSLMGGAAQKEAAAFSSKIVASKTLDIYRWILNLHKVK